MAESGGSKEKVERYDVLVLVKRYSVTGPSDESREWIGIGGSLDQAREELRRVRAAGGLGIVVPTRYRDAPMSEATAKEIARAEHGRLSQGRHGEFSELSNGGDEGACWHFTVEDLAAQDEGLIPGTRRFLVDKLDGHLWSGDEATAFWRLSALSQ